MIPITEEKRALLPDPLITRDVHDPDWMYRQDVHRWLDDQGLSADDVWRYEVYIMDTPCAVLFRYVKDSMGRYRLRDRDSDDLVSEVVMTLITTYPPDLVE